MKAEMIANAYPLSPLQEGMLFHSLSAREPGVDLEQILCTLREEVNVPAFERAWQRVVERHDILRTSFRWEGLDEPRQEVHPRVRVHFETKDWRGLPEPERLNRFEAFLQADRRRGFELSVAPLMRLALIRTGDAEHQLVWTFHHLLIDGRSVVLVFNEVFAFYGAFRAGRELELDPPPAYRDHLACLERQDLTKSESFWRQTLAGFTAPTPLPGASTHTRTLAEDSIYAAQEIVLPATTKSALKSFAKKNGLTLNTLVQGAWALLLGRHSATDDVVFGAVRAGRRSTVANADSIVGLFINTVPVRARLDPEAPLVPWLGTLREQWVSVREHEHTRLAKVQSWSETPAGQPLFESLVSFQDPGWDAALRAQGGPWAQREFGLRNQPNYPLVLDVYVGDDLRAKLFYDRRRFDDDAITRLLGHFRTLLEAMPFHSEARVGELPWLTEAERHQLLVEWNDTAADFPKDKCVHELFEAQAARTPDALAVADENHKITYRELDERAEELAETLRELGLGPDVLAGVCLERSVDMVVALLAVLKAGGAYVPLDPSYPPERLAFMLEDARAPVLLTQQSLRENFKSRISNLKLLCVDTPDHASRTTHPDSRPPPPSTLNSQPSTSLAYVIYTSGSTGRPKGVEIQHDSLVNLVTWHQCVYRVTSADRATQLASPAFDAAVWELWPYLTCGASIHIPNEETRRSPRQLLRWLADNRITLTFIPTPLAEAMLGEPWPGNCAVRALLTGGDKLHRPPGENMPCPLLNHYGPTENTVVTTWTTVPPRPNNAAPPIGRPIFNTRVYVLDRQLQPVPIGVPGELHLSGVGLARGYHHHPDLTAEKFGPNPFSRDPQSRLYKTGDLVRYLPDGNLEFLGRVDQQVKIRGNRIEPGEIESLLSRHPAVREVAVVARADQNGETRLAAYVVAQVSGLESCATAHELREFLNTKLPGYMLPSAFVFLEALPLTPNGKVDHKALPLPDFTAELEKAFVPPRTPIEERVANIWREVLGVQRVGVQDNFFELGGHSLMATQVISRVRSAFDVEIPLRDLFDAPTVAALGERIETLRRTAAPSSVEPERDGEWPLSFAQERLWFLDRLDPGAAFNNIPVALRLEGALNFAALEQAVTEIVRRHKTLRTTFNNANGHPAAVVAPAAALRIPVADLSSLPPAERETEAQRLVSEEARRPFDLAQGPLLRAQLLRLAEAEHVLLLTTHHIACDGWSLGVFYRELTAFYETFSRGLPSPLPDLSMDYADFARSQRAWLTGDVLEKQLAYWKQQLNGAQTTLDLPIGRPRPPIQTYRGALQHFALPDQLASSLNALARREDVTLFMLLLATFQTLLHRYSGQQDILVGSPIAGRTRVETENLIGFFLNTLVLRGDLSGDPAFRDLLKRVRQKALDAYAHQDLPFEKLVDALQLERDLSRSPLFQVMFVLQNEPLRPLELAGLKLAPLPVHSGTAKFDLTLSLEETVNGLAGYVEFNTDLFDAETITRLLGQYQTLLEGVVANTAQRLSQLPLLTEAERNQILVEWNDTRGEFRTDKCVHQLFEKQVERTPDAVALVFDDRRLTYRELNESANVVAHELRGLGVGPDVRVGICVKRSLEMMVGLLGILKAGGGYVPLDPAYPKERLAFMLEDAQVPVLLTQDALQHDFKFETPNLKLLCLDAPRFTRHALRTTAQPSAPNPPVLRSPSSVAVLRPSSEALRRVERVDSTAEGGQPSTTLAYVLYTSGSTGQPKGVMVTHRNVVNFFAGMDRVLGTKPGVWLALTSISFDISVLELFWTLARGFKVVLQRDDERAPGVPEQITRYGVTHVQCTPSLARAFALTPESLQALRRLHKLLLGGEALPVSLARQLGEVVPCLFNMYGPTETTIWSAVHRVEGIGNSIPIGRPIANTQIYILDRNLHPVPAGVPGEIFIGGEGVARGYWNRPELTAEKFIRNPFIGEAERGQPCPRESAERAERADFQEDRNARTRRPALLYKTGDLGRWRANGEIEFLGRLDNQVKLRGHRIELGEVESLLGRHPAVREAVVVAREDQPGDVRLVAYVVAAPDAKPGTTELRHFAQVKLPDAMVPSAFVFLDALPLTLNGKVNRNALPALEGQRPELETAYVAPRTKLEQTVAGIWRELLRVEQVGLHDNFFDLGGHSLLVVQMQARLRAALGRDVPVVKLFQYPTIAALAGFLSEREERNFDSVRDRGRRKQTAVARHVKPEPEVMA